MLTTQNFLQWHHDKNQILKYQHAKNSFVFTRIFVSKQVPINILILVMTNFVIQLSLRIGMWHKVSLMQSVLLKAILPWSGCKNCSLPFIFPFRYDISAEQSTQPLLILDEWAVNCLRKCFPGIWVLILRTLNMDPNNLSEFYTVFAMHCIVYSHYL